MKTRAEGTWLMKFLPTLLALPRCILANGVASGWSATGSVGLSPLPSHKANTRVSLLLGQSQATPNMQKVVETLTELAANVESERDAARALAKQRKQECSNATAELRKSLKKSNRTALEAWEDLQVADAEIKGLEADVKGMQNQLNEAASEIDKVTQRLESLRAEKERLQQQSATSLQQVETVMEQADLRARQSKQHRVAFRHTPLRSHVSYLHELGSHLSSSGAESQPPAASFVQLTLAAADEGGKASGGGSGSGSGSVTGVLRADEQDLMQAREDTTKGFDEDEAKLLDLLKILHTEVQKLESGLREHQPSLADKLRQFAEVNMTSAMAIRRMKQDADMMGSLQAQCDFLEKSSETLDRLRLQLSDLLRMPAKLLRKMDTMMFLARDIQSLKDGSFSFVQFAAHGAQEQRAGGTRAAMRARLWSAAEQPPPTLSLPTQDGMSARSDFARDGQATATSHTQRTTLQELVQEATAATSPSAPFDGVSQVIRALISSLRDESNEDTNRQQWCEQSRAQNLNERLAAQGALDALTSEVRWAENAINRLSAEVTFFESEIPRLRASAAQSEQETEAEQKRVEEQLAEHQQAHEAMSNILLVIHELCGLDDGPSVLKLQQTAATGNAAEASPLLLRRRAALSLGGSRGSCSEAAVLLQQAMEKTEELSQAMREYLRSFEGLFAAYKHQLEQAADEQAAHLLESKSASAKRANELAITKNDENKRKDELRLIEEARDQLEKNCGPHVESPQERLQRRAEEIEALKSALSVLEGQATPV